MNRALEFAVCRYGCAVALVGVALAANLCLPGLEHIAGVLFLAAVTLGAYYGGLGPGLLATLLSTLALDYFLIPDIHRLDFGRATWTALGVFVAVALLINSVTEVQRRLNLALHLHDQRKSAFLAILSHELRNFLSPMTTSTAVLRLRTQGDDAAAQACATVERQVRTMSRLINDLLDAARINQGKIQLTREAVDLNRILAQALETAQPVIEARGHQLEAVLPSEPVLLLADATRLQQIFVNLLTNAAKYTACGGRIVLTVQCQDDAVAVSVKDNGQGIASEMLPHVFDLFAQAEAGAGGGLGVGLSLVRGLVELHGGSVRAASDGPALGSEFVVRLPTPAPPGLGADARTPGMTERTHA